MKTARWLLWPLAMALTLVGCSSSMTTDAETESSLQGYHSLYIEPLVIHYDPSPHQDSLHRGPEAFQLDERQHQRLQQEFEQAVTGAWQRRPGWRQAAAPGPGVVSLKVELDRFRLHAPLRDERPEPAHTLVGESSRFTLVAQLLDSATGEVLLESRQRRVTGERGGGSERLRPFSAVRYWSDFHRSVAGWARQMQRALPSSPGKAEP